MLGASRDPISNPYRVCIALLTAVACVSGCAGADATSGASCPDPDTLSPEVRRLVASTGEGVLMKDVSFDGSVVVGSQMYTPSGTPEAFRWTEAAGIAPLGFVSGYEGTESVALSGDGTTVVGTARRVPASTEQPFRWTEAGGMVGLGFGASQRNRGWATAVSRDGSAVVGVLVKFDPNDGLPPVPFRWTESEGMVVLEPPAGATGAVASAVSADGSTIVGHSFADDTRVTRVFRWTASTGAVNLDAPVDAITRALFVSADGSVIVGVAGALGTVGFRWTERMGFVGLSPLPGFSRSHPTGMSADGSVVVGFCAKDEVDRSLSNRAFRWTEKSGTTPLDLIPRPGPPQANHVVAVSADGARAVGSDYWGPDASAMVPETVTWNAQGCLTRVHPLWDVSETPNAPAALSGDGRTIIGTAYDARPKSLGWVVRLP